MLVRNIINVSKLIVLTIVLKIIRTCPTSASEKVVVEAVLESEEVEIFLLLFGFSVRPLRPCLHT